MEYTANREYRSQSGQSWHPRSKRGPRELGIGTEVKIGTIIGPKSNSAKAPCCLLPQNNSEIYTTPV